MLRVAKSTTIIIELQTEAHPADRRVGVVIVVSHPIMTESNYNPTTSSLAGISTTEVWRRTAPVRCMLMWTPTPWWSTGGTPPNIRMFSIDFPTMRPPVSIPFDQLKTPYAGVGTPQIVLLLRRRRAQLEKIPRGKL